ncbi:hypothetical protein [Litoreibacter roseus]|uniref:Uncharacterized protein n=1 Tax=Litoreibacter roseus TaxID=2601869 RepID=A0A6N6JCB8_9RHOB|nr:hypothetical protein [Litoreibacter roseus]GFE63805.1 hypothetical protein KIN_08790 [Litoreibacter roseus]
MGLRPNRLFEVITRFSGVLRDLEEMGIQIKIGDDFLEYRTYRSQQTDRAPIYPMFDVASSYVDYNNGLWVCGFDPEGELIHTQAVRLLDLSGISLAGHLNLHRHKYITPDSTPDPDQTFFSGPEALNAITGKVGYQGDFWLRAKGLAGPRSQGATALLSRLLLEMTVIAWDPSFVFAFVPKRLAAKGAHLRYGYTHCEAGRWIGPDQQVTDEDYLIWMSAKDLAASFAQATQSLRRHESPLRERARPASHIQIAELNSKANA